MNSPMVDMNKHGMTLIASVICVLVILFDTSLPREIIDGAKSNIGKVFMALILIAMFATTHPIAGVLAIIAFWKLSVSESYYSKSVSFKEPEQASAPAPSTGADDIPKYNNANAVVSGDIGGSLEEEMVAKMAPPKKSSGETSTETYVPVLDTSITATSLESA